MSVVSRLKKFRRRLNLLFLRNHIGIYYNFLHFLNGLLSRQVFSEPTENEDVLQQAEQLKQDGFLVLPPDSFTASAVERLSVESQLCFSRAGGVVKTFDEGGMHRLSESLIQLPALEEVLLQERVVKIVSAYYRSHFKVYSCDVYRTFPQKKENIESFLWHIDNAPRDALKIMIYLNDVSESNGALSLLPKSPTRSLQLKGLVDRTDAALYEDEIQKDTRKITGPKGTIIFFAAQYCLHRGSYVKEGYRDVATFLIFPSVTGQRRFTEADRMTFSKNFGYLLNPFTGKALRTGDE